MKNTIKTLFMLCSLAGYVIVAGCDDLIQRDISGGFVGINTPQDSFVSNKYDITFWWEETSHAQKYRLQIVSPSFMLPQLFIADTLIDNMKITLQLQPGSYQWRLRAENGNSYTPYVTRMLIVDTNSDLTNMVFNVNVPAAGLYTNRTVTEFSWFSFPYATIYEYMLTDMLNGSVKKRTTTLLGITDTLPEGNYSWAARAINETNGTMTAYSVPRNLYVDLTPPVPSTPLFPEDNSLDTNTIQLRWLKAGDGYADSVWIAADSLFHNIVQRYYTNGTSQALQPLGIFETYYWRIRTRDRAGNWSDYSTRFRFTVTL